MRGNILIVEDELIVAADLRLLLEKSGFSVCGIARSFQKAMEMISVSRPDMIFLDIFLKGSLTGIDLAQKLKEENIPFIFLSANSSADVLAAAKKTQPDGFLVKPYREKDLFITLEIAAYRHEHSLETSYRKEALFRQQLLQAAAEPSVLKDKLEKILPAMQSFIPFDYVEAGFKDGDDPPTPVLSLQRTGFDEYRITGARGLTVSGGAAPVFECHLAIPIPLSNDLTFFFSFFSRRPDVYKTEHTAVFTRLRDAFQGFFEPVAAIRQGEGQRSAAGNEVSAPLANEAQQGKGPEIFKGIIGKSHLLLNVFDQIMQVAATDTSVLILGESGTGKERIADSIHGLSPRKQGPLIKVNCATLPASLVESELFGHEKGAFTGAYDRRIGKFEQAHTGTIFLDEIGEMPMDLQVKLLRVLQEKEIERIGGTRTIRIDIRIIAATNRNLEKAVAEGRFRLDLYYRLNTFPVQLPALRQRREDISALTAHFIAHYNRKTGKKITGITDKTLRALEAYHWPGNIRELEHVIERSVLMAKGKLIEEVLLPVHHKDLHFGAEDSRVKTIHENERDHIITVLKKCKGRIWGPGGAAEMLNVPPTTLNSKMKKLGIQRDGS